MKDVKETLLRLGCVRPAAYIGDAVYVGFDGYSVVLATQRENGTHWMALEPPVYARLASYIADLHAKSKAEPSGDPAT